jgi:C4-dicarboxylate-specific signal transduction histidine kinase
MEHVSANESFLLWSSLRQSVREHCLELDQNGTILAIDPELEVLSGFAPHQLLGRSIDTLQASGHPPLFLSDPRIDAAGAEMRNAVSAVRTAAGGTLPVYATTQQLANGSLRWKVTLADAAQVSRLCDTMINVQRLAGIGALASSLSGELNDPLGLIAATCASLLDELSQHPASQQGLAARLRLIEQTAFRSAHQFDVLRDYLDPGDLEMAVTDVETIIRDVRILVGNEFLKQNGVQLEVHLAKEQRSLVCDHKRIAQVLVSLLTNACEAMQPGGGVIHLRVWSATELDRADCVPAYNNGRLVRPLIVFTVRDQGPGVTAPLMARLFEPFFTTKPSGRGAGLGLFVSRMVVRQHRGCLWAENNLPPESGATFTVALPQRPT